MSGRRPRHFRAALIASAVAVLLALLSTAPAYALDAVSTTTTDTTTSGTTTTTTPTTTTTTPTTTSPTTTSPTTTSPTTTSPTTTSPTTTSPTAEVPSAAGEYVESVPTSSGSRATSSGPRNSASGVGSSVTTLKDIAPSLDATKSKHRAHKRRHSPSAGLVSRDQTAPAQSSQPALLSKPVSSQAAEGVPVLWLFIALFAITGLSLGVFGYQRTRRAGF